MHGERGQKLGVPKTRNKQRLLRELERIRAMSPAIKKPPFGWQLIREDRDRR